MSTLHNPSVLERYTAQTLNMEEKLLWMLQAVMTHFCDYMITLPLSILTEYKSIWLLLPVEQLFKNDLS